MIVSFFCVFQFDFEIKIFAFKKGARDLKSRLQIEPLK